MRASFFADKYYNKSSVVRPTLLYLIPDAVIPAKTGIQIENNGFPRIKYGAGLVKLGMTIKVKGLLTQYTRFTGLGRSATRFFVHLTCPKASSYQKKL